MTKVKLAEKKNMVKLSDGAMCTIAKATKDGPSNLYEVRGTQRNMFRVSPTPYLEEEFKGVLSDHSVEEFNVTSDVKIVEFLRL